MKPIRLMLFLLMTTLILAGCGLTATDKPTGIGAKPEPSDTAVCPTATEDDQLLHNAAHGYCLLYPAEYKVEKPTESETVLVIGSLLNASDPRLHIGVEPLGDRSVVDIADQTVADYEGFELDRDATTIGGQEAVVLDMVPGQEFSRRLLFAHGDRLYSLLFSPADPALGDAFTRMEALYEKTLNTFTFAPPSDEVADDCLAPTPETQLVTSEALGFCVLAPAGYQSEQPTESEVVLFVGSLMDVEQPKVFIEIADANGRAADAFAADIMTEFETIMPGQVEQTYGYTLGYENAPALYNVPGQDLSRQLFAVHDGKLYKLTFVPEGHADLDDLFDLVLKSFRFLN